MTWFYHSIILPFVKRKQVLFDSLNSLDEKHSWICHHFWLVNPTDGVQVERTWDLVRDSGQRKLTSSFQNHCTLHSVPVGAKPLSPRQCAPSRSIYLSRRLNSHWEILVTTHHLQKWESHLRLRWKIPLRIARISNGIWIKRFLQILFLI